MVFVDKRSYPTYEALVKGIQDEIKARTGLDISSSNIGIRSMKGEVMREGEASTDARLLEIAEKNIKGKNVPILMNTYSVLLRMVTELPEGAPVEDIIAALGRMIPGLSYDKIKKVFSYLPPIVPEDYQSDYENNRRSAEFVLSAA